MSPRRPTLSEFTTTGLEYGQIRKPKDSTAKVVGVSTVPGSQEIAHRISLQLFEDERGRDASSILFTISPPPNDMASMRWNLDLSVSPDSPLYNALLALDERNILEGVAKSEEWFGRALERSVIETMYTPVLKKRPDGTYCMKVKVNVGDRPTSIWIGSFEGDEMTYKSISEHKPADLSYADGVMAALTRHSKALVIANTQGLWVVNRTFGMCMNAEKIMVVSSSGEVNGVEDFNMPGLTFKRQKVEAAAKAEAEDAADY